MTTNQANRDIRELEQQALKILEKNPNNKQQIKELLKQHATKHTK